MKLDFQHILLALVAILTPVAPLILSRLTAHEITTTEAVLVDGVAALNAVLALLKSSPIESLLYARRLAAKARALAAKVAPVALLVLACSCGYLKANEAPIISATERIGCDVADVLDPAQSVVICSGLDALGGVIETFAPFTTTTTDAAAWVKRFPGTAPSRSLVVRVYRKPVGF